MDKEEPYSTEFFPDPVGYSEGTGGPTLSQSNKPASHQLDPYLLAIMQQTAQIMDNLQEALRPPAFKTPSIKEPECFIVTQPFKGIRFIQPSSVFSIMIRKISSKTRRNFFMSFHFSMEGLQNGLSLNFSILKIKTQASSSIIGNYLNKKY
ncbi:hypothetical protein O181_080062 [Austropuccinia psidii MF-1]|uniref:Uncharacterized protein n=1 Tax=Austropuccinia psidii MF-1 TaxID=1389203 RepID=A0A9Q3FN79_9BASI|nr:hypothetical protein [Austropuccinia psidii MF-1]